MGYGATPHSILLGFVRTDAFVLWVLGASPQEGVPPLHPLQNFRFAVLDAAALRKSYLY